MRCVVRHLPVMEKRNIYVIKLLFLLYAIIINTAAFGLQSNFKRVLNSALNDQKGDHSRGLLKDRFFAHFFGVNSKRFVVFNSFAVLLALGSPSVLLPAPTLTEVFAKESGWDQFYSINGYRRYNSIEKGNSIEKAYEFLFPNDWVQDQRLVLANMRARELPEQLRNQQPSRPDVAYGPVAGDSLENLSVVISRLMPGFTLKGTLSEPKEAAERLLSTTIAPESSGKIFRLLDAHEEMRNGVSAYVFEYTVQKGESFFQHAVSVVTYRNDLLYTFTAVAPQRLWLDKQTVIFKVANSFQLL